MKKLLLICSLLSCALSVHANDYSDGYFAKTFKSPSGNIVCMGDSLDDEISELRQGVSCFIFNHQNIIKPTKDEQECPLDWTTGYTLERTGKGKYEGVCHGDIFWNYNAKALNYGQSIKGNGWQCNSKTTGITCTNTSGSGFHINKKSQKVW
ncbi:DUF6636 domain-containing protein [Moraxella sp. ZY210820]|uniref:DUF6636 domain-containing protein n=1 Tax=unclassified Moraxella TaxID=2685852 RepID=UPI00272FF5E3|nr:DUF6636 domain-containing protein [Moraxella sp. ZY210820]WLF84727.1 hypothetical protein LU301_04435 [Moraxella sp. ZY210820]